MLPIGGYRRGRLTALITAVVCALASPVALAQDMLFVLSSKMTNNGPATMAHVNPSVEAELDIGAKLLVPTLDGQLLEATVTQRFEGSGLASEDKGLQRETVVLSLAEGKGSVELVRVDGQLTTLSLFDSQKSRFHQARIDAQAQGVLQESTPQEHLCMRYPASLNGGALLPSVPLSADQAGDAPTIPSLAEIKSLQSNPGATNVLFINFWGGRLTGTAWNDAYRGGAPIDFQPFSDDADSSTFSASERYLIWLAFNEVAEDFAAFDVNVTTDLAVYNATDSMNRLQNIATSTNVIAPQSGGIAFVNVFDTTTDYYKTSWTWNTSAGSLGMTISHEIGHQLGLLHDGTNASEYYTGHGEWGPVMGAAFDKKYVQFSRGEYSNASNTQNDLLLIRDRLGSRTDEAAESNATAAPLTLPVDDRRGVITPTGLGADTDHYRFSLDEPADLRLVLGPVLGVNGDELGSNLSMLARLEDSNGATIAEIAPSYLPSTNVLNYSGRLPAGEYFLDIRAQSPDLNWATGFGEYGNGGLYSLSLSTVVQEPTFADVKPTHPAFEMIERIVLEGITDGCEDDPLLIYCPSKSITRAQMAVFLLRAKYGGSYQPDAGDGQMFYDVGPTHPKLDWIEGLADEGITLGCGGGNFCPKQSITRAQMAVMILRTLYGSSYTPPPAEGLFIDVSLRSNKAPWIEELARLGITGGCGEGIFCPSNSVTRSQMAAFMVRAFFSNNASGQAVRAEGAASFK